MDLALKITHVTQHFAPSNSMRQMTNYSTIMILIKKNDGCSSVDLETKINFLTTTMRLSNIRLATTKRLLAFTVNIASTIKVSQALALSS